MLDNALNFFRDFLKFPTACGTEAENPTQMARGSAPDRSMEDPFLLMTAMATAHEATVDLTNLPGSGGGGWWLSGRDNDDDRPGRRPADIRCGSYYWD